LALSESGWDDDTRRLIEAIAAATGLPVHPELEEWMARGTEESGADPEERPALKAALAALANGDTLLAEASFEQELAVSRRLRLAAILSRWARCRPLPQGVRYQCLGGPPTAVGDPAG
jgi:hypothetical protein